MQNNLLYLVYKGIVMKKIIFCGLLLLSSLVGWTQTNMVPNGDFEYFSPCPSSLSQTANCTGWSSWTNGTSDYLNDCATAGGVDVPGNTFGYQYAASGKAYVGGYQNATPTSGPYKEYVTRAIIPLQIGAKYEVSISVSLANQYGKVGVDDIGIYFFKNGPTSIPVTTRVAVVPQIEFSGNGAYTDTQNWVRLVKTFVADSAYDHIVIGSFKDPNLVVTQPVGSGTGTTSYYYFDSVVVKTNDSVFFSFAETAFCAGDTFDLSYNTAAPGLFGSGNIFTAQLSDPTGSFAGGTTDIGTLASSTDGVIPCIIPLTVTPSTTYRIRILASKPNFASKPNEDDITIGVHPVNLDATVESPICVGDAINLNASTSTNDVDFEWTGPSGFTDVVPSPTISSSNDTNVGVYYVTGSVYHCKSIDSVEVTTTPYPEVSIINNSPVCVDSTLVLISVADTTGLVYSWTGPDNFSSDKDRISIPKSTHGVAGTYTLVASNNGCEVKVSTDAEVIDISFNLGDDVLLCDGETRLLTPGGIAGTYLWQDGSTDTTFTVMEQNVYHLTVKHPVCGVRTDTVEIFYEKCECEPFVPNAFTPNNDSHNDKIGPILDCNTNDYMFMIINRFGEVVFKSVTPGEKWDGIYKGEPAEVSTYYYLLQVAGPRGKRFQFKGDIVLIR